MRKVLKDQLSFSPTMVKIASMTTYIEAKLNRSDKQAFKRMQISCKIASIWEMFHLKHNANSHWEMSLKKKERKTLHVLFGVMSF